MINLNQIKLFLKLKLIKIKRLKLKLFISNSITSFPLRVHFDTILLSHTFMVISHVFREHPRLHTHARAINVLHSRPIKEEESHTISLSAKQHGNIST